MPTYDYECRACGHELEAFHSMSADPLRECPECGKPELKRKIGPGAGLIFKGSGFYQTDYRSDNYKKEARKEKGGGDGGGESGEAPKKDGGGGTDSAAEKAKPKTSPSTK